ncbi:MAG: chromosome segregation protein SMC [Oscillospiraceae bacterium]
MYLKSLELQGFKSFPDKIKLDFDKGLTAVVGPNGSGKSNIGDAVRWVLGEQSSKTLRGAKMEDVIFAGTQFRKPMGFAQVTLNIDNSKGILQVPAEEVCVTRKLYRSGESEYLINGSQVRLKDVYELFMDTGLGRDGYSIIGQGRVAEIVSAKSSERREIFEEAAGISKLRYKKAESEKRLSAAQDNILRLKDIINELEVRVEPLRIQAEKTKKYNELAEKRKSLEVSFWVKKLDDLRKNIKSVDEKILINTAEYESLCVDVEKIETEIQNCHSSMQDGNIKIEQLQEKIIETERKNGQINSDIAVFENDIIHNIELINNYIAQQQSSAVSSMELREKIADGIMKAENLSKDEIRVSELLSKFQSELEELIAKSDEFNREYEKIESEINHLYIKRSEYSFAVSSSEKTVKELLTQIEEQKNHKKETEEAIFSLKKEKEETDKGIKATEESFDELNNKLSGYTRLYESKSKKLNDYKEKLQSLVIKKNEISHRVQILTELENNMEGFSYSVKEIIKAGKNQRISGIHGSVAQLIKVDSEYSVAIETALGAALQNVIVENEDTAKRCIRLLKEQKSGRATFLPLTSVKGNKLDNLSFKNENGYISLASELVEFDECYAHIMNYLLGRIAVAEDIDSASYIAKKCGYKFKIVTLDGQVINAGGSFTGGSVSKSAGVLTRKNEINSLKSELDKVNSEYEAIKSETIKLQAESDKLGFDIDGVKDRISEVNEDKIRFEEENKRIEQLIAQAGSQIDLITANEKQINDRITTENSKHSEAEILLDECEKKISESEALVSSHREEKDSIHKKREELSSDISSQKLLLLEIRKDKENAEAGVEQLKASALELKQNAIDYETQIEKQNDIIEEKKALIEQRKKELTDSFEEVKEIKAQIVAVQTENRSFEQKAGTLRKEERELSENKERFSAEKARLLSRRESIQKECDDISSEMWEQYEMTRSDAEKIAIPIDDMLVAQRDLNEVKNKIKSLGSINPSAIEEYEEVSGRYQFMSEQLSDVETSKKELERLIEELTNDMKRRFSESFEEINNNFKQVFVELFGGGKAELVLVNPDDILESGIEINVAPPGKVIKNLSLLSGGEQSFVAIAIYFAILKLRPAPFCILDEIEAALDDVNVSKYAQYLRNFTDTTQFILVTHRRGTMDEADVLYGVTMQEKGISKLLKMSHDEINSMATDN